MNKQVELFSKHCKAGQDLFAIKNAQYGNAFEMYGVLGVTCEILGAVARLPQLVLWSPEHGKIAKENLVDIFTDIHNFAIMTLMCIEKENWDGR